MDELRAITEVFKPGFVCLTETWFYDYILDSAIAISDYVFFRKDRVNRQCGGVGAYIDSRLPCQHLAEYEATDTESLWISVRPFRLPRTISKILIGVVYHPPDSSSEKNDILTDHLQKNTDTFLNKHPDGLVLIIGDFNPASTGIKAQVKQRTGLSQLVNVLTRDTGILDWALTNKPKFFSSPTQRPKIGRSDHYAVLVKPSITLHTSKPKEDRKEDRIKT